MKAIKVVVRTSTYPPHLDGLPRSTMFAVSRMCLLTQIQLHLAAQVPERHIADLYINVSPTALLKIMLTAQLRDSIS